MCCTKKKKIKSSQKPNCVCCVNMARQKGAGFKSFAKSAAKKGAIALATLGGLALLAKNRQHIGTTLQGAASRLTRENIGNALSSTGKHIGNAAASVGTALLPSLVLHQLTKGDTVDGARTVQRRPEHENWEDDYVHVGEPPKYTRKPIKQDDYDDFKMVGKTTMYPKAQPAETRSTKDIIQARKDKREGQLQEHREAKLGSQRAEGIGEGKLGDTKRMIKRLRLGNSKKIESLKHVVSPEVLGSEQHQRLVHNIVQGVSRLRESHPVKRDLQIVGGALLKHLVPNQKHSKKGKLIAGGSLLALGMKHGNEVVNKATKIVNSLKPHIREFAAYIQSLPQVARSALTGVDELKDDPHTEDAENRVKGSGVSAQKRGKGMSRHAARTIVNAGVNRLSGASTKDSIIQSVVQEVEASLMDKMYGAVEKAINRVF